MSATSKNVIVTKAARQKLAKARAGAITLPKVIGVAFGDGGVNASGAVVPPSASQTGLTHELFRKPIDKYEVLTTEDATVRYVCTLAENELAGESVSEIGLYDAAGDILCVKTFTPKGKDDDIEQTYTLDDIF